MIDTKIKIRELKDGDKVSLEIIGVGIGEAEIRMIEGELYLHEDSQGTISLDEAEISKHIYITSISKK